MDTQKMRYLLKIAELQSVTEAAKELYISQPALSQIIAYMEREHSIKIFERKDRKLVLTPAGTILIDSIRQELRIEENLKRQLDDVKSEQTGTINIGLSHARAAQFLPVVLPEFTKLYPKIVLNINTNSSLGFETIVVDGKVDFAFVMDTANISPAKKAQLVYEPLFPYCSLLAVPPNHPIAEEANGIFNWTKRPPIDLSRVKDEPFIRLIKNPRNTLLNQSIFNKYGFEPKERIVMTDESMICQLVEAGVGFALIQEHHALARKSGVYFMLDCSDVTSTLCLIYRKDAYLTKPANDFIELIRHHSRLGTWQVSGY